MVLVWVNSYSIGSFLISQLNMTAKNKFQKKDAWMGTSTVYKPRKKNNNDLALFQPASLETTRHKIVTPKNATMVQVNQKESLKEESPRIWLYRSVKNRKSSHKIKFRNIVNKYIIDKLEVNRVNNSTDSLNDIPSEPRLKPKLC